MTLFIEAGLLFALSALLLGPASTSLARAKWVGTAPRAAIALWQSIGISAIFAGIGAGLCVGVERFHHGFAGGLAQLFDGLALGHPLLGLGLPDALGLTLATDLGFVLIFLLAYTTVRTARARARHRRLVDLLSNEVPNAIGARLLDHPKAVAYCLPGFRPRIVISAGTVQLLSESELAAVVRHERCHASERHGLVMLPMVCLRNIFRWIPYAQLASTSVAGLLEMAADDYSVRHDDPRSLASALVSMATAGAPPTCALSFASVSVTERVSRLLSNRRTSRKAAVAAAAACAVLLVTPVAALLAS